MLVVGLNHGCNTIQLGLYVRLLQRTMIPRHWVLEKVLLLLVAWLEFVLPLVPHSQSGCLIS